jgi:predicted amino acid racemase
MPALSSPRMEINLTKLRENAQVVSGWCGAAGLRLLAVTKGVRGDPHIARAFLRGGAAGLADSRLANLKGLIDLGDVGNRPGGAVHLRSRPSLLLLRAPTPAQAGEAVALSDAVLCAGADTAEALAREVRPGHPYEIFLTVDLGDLREGLLPEDLTSAALAIDRRLAGVRGEADYRRRAHVAGLAANTACFCGVIPTRAHLDEMLYLAADAGEALGRPLTVSAGNTAVLPLLLSQGVPAGLGDLRIGEGLLLGRESLHRTPLPGCHLDAFTFWGAVIEIGVKPSAPTGECAENAFGHAPVFVDRGRRLRAIVAAGRQDMIPEGLTPLETGIEIVGATSDHMVLDVGDYPGRLRVGDELGFSVNYASLLQAMTSSEVVKAYVGEA